MDLKIRGWVAAGFTALAAAAGLGFLASRDPLEGHEPVHIKDPRFDPKTGSIRAESVQAFSALSFPAVPEALTVAARHPGSAASAAESEKLPELSIEQKDNLAAQSFFKKYQKETLSTLRRYKDLTRAYELIGQKMEKADLFGITPDELAEALRQAAREAIQEYKTHAPQTNLEKIMVAKEIWFALENYAGMQSDGTNNKSWAEANLGMSIESIDSYKKDLAIAAASEAVKEFKGYDLFDGENGRKILESWRGEISAVSDDQLLAYWDRLDLIGYAAESYNLPVKGRPAERARAIGTTRDQVEFYRDMKGEIEKEMVRRTERVAMQEQTNANAGSKLTVSNAPRP